MNGATIFLSGGIQFTHLKFYIFTVKYISRRIAKHRKLSMALFQNKQHDVKFTLYIYYGPKRLFSRSFNLLLQLLLNQFSFFFLRMHSQVFKNGLFWAVLTGVVPLLQFDRLRMDFSTESGKVSSKKIKKL